MELSAAVAEMDRLRAELRQRRAMLVRELVEIDRLLGGRGASVPKAASETRGRRPGGVPGSRRTRVESFVRDSGPVTAVQCRSAFPDVRPDTISAYLCTLSRIGRIAKAYDVERKCFVYRAPVQT